MKTEDISGFPNLTVDPATIDEIVVLQARKVTIMSNILKSTKLDIALVKPYFKTICFTLLLPIVFAAINRSLLTGVSFAMCFIAMTTGYTFSITEKNSMDRLFGILPVRKSELVIGRYVFVLAMGLLSLIISLIAQPLVLKVLGETVGVFDIVTAAIAGVFLFALYTVFQIRDITSTAQSKDGYLCIFQWPVFW